MDIQETISQLKQFRQELYEAFDLRRDALMELIDALSSTLNARSVVELSLSPFFRRHYSSVHDAIAHLFRPSEPEKADEERRAVEQKWVRLIASYLPEPQRQKFWLFGTDVVTIPRPFARTLADRTFVHQSNTLKGNKPVTIGHQYSKYPSWRSKFCRQGFKMIYEEGICWFPFKRESNSPLVPMFTQIERYLGLRRLPSVSPWIVFVAQKGVICLRAFPGIGNDQCARGHSGQVFARDVRRC